MFMKKKLSFKPAFSATVITLFVFSVVLIFIGFVLYLLVKESVGLYFNNLSFFKSIFSGYNLLDVLRGLIMSDKMVSTISNTAVSALKIIPIIITLIIISFVFTVFLINNISKITNSILYRIKNDSRVVVKGVLDNSKIICKKFLRSYFILYFLTFIESLIVFWFVGVDYPLVFAFIAAVADFLPVLGPGAVYVPIAVISYINGNILSAIVLIIFWAAVVILRQIIEPKIVSGTIKIHPLVVLSGLYFSIASSNIWVFFYVLLFVLVYKILVESSVLTPVFDVKNKGNKEDY